MTKEERTNQIKETAQKAIGTFNYTINELPELEATELLIILYGVFLYVADKVKQDPDSLYFSMKESIGYTKTADGYALHFPSDFVQGDDE